MPRGLTIAQEHFVQHLINGKSQREAYRLAFPKSTLSDEATDVKACNLFKLDKVRLRYDELVERAANKSIMSAIERKEWLTKMIAEQSNNNNDRLKALDILNKMDGTYITKTVSEISVKNYETALLQVISDEEED